MPITANNGSRSRMLDHDKTLACGSASTSSTRPPAAASVAATLMATVVLPTPPFRLSTPMIIVCVKARQLTRQLAHQLFGLDGSSSNKPNLFRSAHAIDRHPANTKIPQVARIADSLAQCTIGNDQPRQYPKRAGLSEMPQRSLTAAGRSR